MLEQQTRLRVLIADDIADVRHDLRLLLEELLGAIGSLGVKESHKTGGLS
jgi:hypoxanthine phosphoribosyltransferase